MKARSKALELVIDSELGQFTMSTEAFNVSSVIRKECARRSIMGYVEYFFYRACDDSVCSGTIAV